MTNIHHTMIRINSLPWLNPRGNKAASESKGLDMNIIFKLCAELSDDPYWKEKFMGGYQNKFPPNVSFRDGILSSKTKEISISNKPEEAYLQIINFFKNICFLKSPLDLERERYQEKQDYYNYKPKTSWKQYKTKTIKKNLLMDYIYKLQLLY